MEIICHHCQQSAEKMLKGFQLLLRMCNEIKDKFEKIEDACIRLTAYGVQSRYPAEIEVLESDMRLAIDDANLIKNFISELILNRQ